MIKPFSALYFIKENKPRCILLMFMVFLTYVAYLGGLYVTNIRDTFNHSVETLKEFAIVNELYSDENGDSFIAAKELVEKNENLKYIPLGVGNALYIKNIMGFETDVLQYTFNTVDDFKYFCDKINITCDFDNLKSGDFIMSKMFADNLGLKIGDIVSPEYEMALYMYGNFILREIVDIDGYAAYFIDEQDFKSKCLISNDKMTDEEFNDFTNNLADNYDISIWNSEMFLKHLNGQFEAFNYIYFFIVLILAFVLAITINAAFVGAYQKRVFEFAIYKGMGFSNKTVCKKIISEILMIDAIGLIAGGAVFFCAIYLINNLFLYPTGKYLCYYHPLAITGIIICNLIVVIPLMITRCKNLLKADICEY